MLARNLSLPLPPPYHTPCQPHTRAMPPSARTSLSPLGVSDFACRCRRFCRCRSVALVVAVVNFIYHLTFFTVFMLPKGVLGGGACYSQRHTLSDFWSTLFCIQNICLVAEYVCAWVCMCLRLCVSACVCERLCMCCVHLICLITLGCLIGVAAAFILQLRFKPWPETFGMYHF